MLDHFSHLVAEGIEKHALLSRGLGSLLDHGGVGDLFDHAPLEKPRQILLRNTRGHDVALREKLGRRITAADLDGDLDSPI